MVAPVNPQILTWARERIGLTIANVATILKKEPNEVASWENGNTYPSYTTAEQLAYEVFKLPLAVLFFPYPPKLDDPAKRFRRLPEYEVARFSSDTYHKIHLAQAYQDSLMEMGDSITVDKKITDHVNPNGLNPSALAKKVRTFIGLTLDEQFGYKRPETAFKAWRRKIELSGIFSFKDSFKDEYISGLSLLHHDFPVILINNSTSFTRQLFTLAHELGHILYGLDGVTDSDESYIDMMSVSEKTLEIKCNAFAAELLVPSDSFRVDIQNQKEKDLVSISKVAEKYCVSREVIARKLLEFGLITNSQYLSFRQKFMEEYKRNYGKTSGGNYYLTKLSYLGEGFAKTAFEVFRKGRFSQQDLCVHLNVKAKNLSKLQSYLGF
jgi:Zn-dependent peptidase ImmA (M78 family)